jgi:nucleoside-diphosphate-sugar epimerase
MIRWISETVGIGAFETVDAPSDVFLLDVRDLVDKGGNIAGTVRMKIDDALAARRAGRRVVVCCDYGISRSSAIAAGVIAAEAAIPYDDAVRRVIEATGETGMRIEVLAGVRSVLEGADLGRPPREKRSLVVTGGSGFLGRQLVQRLVNLYDVTAPSHAEVDLMRDAVALDHIVRERGADTVIHLANPRVYGTNAAIGESVVSLKNVLDVCALHDIHLIFPSSWEVFSGYRSSHMFADESVPPNPSSAYGHAKLLCERLIEQVHAQTGLRHTLLRIGPVYGAGGARPKFIWNFIGKAARGEPIVTHRYGNGEPALDLTHVEDVLESLASVVDRRPESKLHLGTGIATSTRVIAEMIVSLTRSSSTVGSHPIDGFAANIAMDSTRARSLLGWAPTHSLEEGLRELIDGWPGRGR